MLTNSPADAVFFHCDSCGGRIQTAPQFAGVSAPCPFCAYPVTAPAAATAWAPAAGIERPPIRRMVLPTLQNANLGEKQAASVDVAPRVIAPSQSSASQSSVGHDSGDRAATKLEQLFNSMVELEGQLDRKIRKKAPFDRPLRRTEDIARRAMG